MHILGTEQVNSQWSLSKKRNSQKFDQEPMLKTWPKQAEAKRYAM